MIAQIDHQARSTSNLTLQKLSYYIAPSMETMRALDSLVNSLKVLNDKKEYIAGGLILSMLSEKIIAHGGYKFYFDISQSSVKELYSFLLKEASKPYHKILRAWINQGHLHDYYNEFMIEERTSATKENLKDDYNDAYWEQRYSIRHEWVPSFLENHKQNILLSGKYLNVLYECGKFVSSVDFELLDTVNDNEPATLIREIEESYLKSNRRLLQHLWDDQNLMDRLRSIKNMFLVSQSDYLTHFLDLAIEELKKPADKVSLPKLKSLLELVVRSPSTACSADPYKDCFTIELSKMSLIDQLFRISTMVYIDNGRSGSISKNLKKKLLPANQ